MKTWRDVSVIVGSTVVTAIAVIFTLSLHAPTIQEYKIDKLQETINNITEDDIDNAKIIQESLCIENGSYQRQTFIIWYKGDAVSSISVGSQRSFCWELGWGEGTWDFKVSKGLDGTKHSFYSNTVTIW